MDLATFNGMPASQQALWFETFPATAMSLLKRTQVFGVGINDAPFITKATIEGKRRPHPAYMAWKSMLQRCYYAKEHAQYPSYIGCSVCPEWLTFSTFHSWWKIHHRDGYHLDKDLLVPGNKVYSPDTCVFVPPELNTFLIDSARARGKYLIGVNKHSSRRERYIAYVCINKQQEYLGLFDDMYDAHDCWWTKKLELAEEFRTLCDTIHPQLFDGVLANINAKHVKRL